VVGRTALVVALLSIAVLLLIVGVVLRMGGLDLAADVAQLVSVLLAVPGAAVPLIDKLHARTPTIEAPEVVRATAEIRDASYVAAEDTTGRRVLVPASGHSLRVTVETAERAAVILRDPPSGDPVARAGFRKVLAEPRHARSAFRTMSVPITEPAPIPMKGPG
jgi:hypothetical protein